MQLRYVILQWFVYRSKKKKLKIFFLSLLIYFKHFRPIRFFSIIEYLNVNSVGKRIKSYLIEKKKKKVFSLSLPSLALALSRLSFVVEYDEFRSRTRLFPLFSEQGACTFTSRRNDICVLMRVLASYSLRFFFLYACMSTFIILPMGFVCSKEGRKKKKKRRRRRKKLHYSVVTNIYKDRNFLCVSGLQAIKFVLSIIELIKQHERGGFLRAREKPWKRVFFSFS